MPGSYGFDLSGASQSFNVLADYLFGKVENEVLDDFVPETYSTAISSLVTTLLADY